MIKCSVSTVEGHEVYLQATLQDIHREGFSAEVFSSKPPGSKEGFIKNGRAVLRWFLGTGAGHLLAIEDDVCLGAGFNKWVDLGMDLAYPAITFGVLSKYLLPSNVRRRALAGNLRADFYSITNTRSNRYWGSQAVMVSRSFAESMWAVGPKPMDTLLAIGAQTRSQPIYGVVPCPIRHMRMKTTTTSRPRLQVVSYRGVLGCEVHGGWEGIEPSWEERDNSAGGATK